MFAAGIHRPLPGHGETRELAWRGRSSSRRLSMMGSAPSALPSSSSGARGRSTATASVGLCSGWIMGGVVLFYSVGRALTVER